MAYGYSRYSCPFAMCPIEGRIMGSEPERGDVVVFRHPVNGSDMIKRLIGLPGDTIQMKDGVLWINGQEVPQQPDGIFEEIYEPQGPMANLPRCENAPVGQGGVCTRSRFIETLPNGRSHSVLNIDSNGYGDNTDVFTVPPGQYFFMGDNRDNSTDSRYSQTVGGVGFLPAEFLIGRADRIVFSSAGSRMWFFWTWRADRFFKAIE
jgi:signal peptidase I